MNEGEPAPTQWRIVEVLPATDTPLAHATARFLNDNIQ
jgi:hypothetical protein